MGLRRQARDQAGRLAEGSATGRKCWGCPGSGAAGPGGPHRPEPLSTARGLRPGRVGVVARVDPPAWHAPARGDRKSTRLNSSHVRISYAVFCLKKKKNKM